MFYRIAESDDWLRARETGRFASADLAVEGFIHGSELSQVLRTANKYYRGKHGLVLLEIDEALLGFPVVREDLSGSGALFPHCYAPIPLTAIVRHFSFDESAAGEFVLPDALSS
jgi:uncharacterized protein (DUF952 family)